MTDNIKKITKDWIDSYGGEFILSDVNKLNEEMAAICKNETIYLASKKYNSPIFSPKLYFEQNGDVIKIHDILMKNNNIGNGTIAMKALLKIAERLKAKEIVGMMSEIDNDHVDRRNHFYEKFGFVILNNYARKVL